MITGSTSHPAGLRFRSKIPPSRLEETFLRRRRLAGAPELEREYRFDPERRWRAVIAHLPTRGLIEIEGEIWVNGRHNRAAGFTADLEKYLEAGLSGWRVFRLGPDQITMPVIERLVVVLSTDP